MDRHSEVEIKFDAQRVSLTDYHKFLVNLSGEVPNTKQIRIEAYKVVKGRDTFYDLNGEILRYRDDGGGGCLTYKKRKSDKSLMDRIEIDLPLSSAVEARDVHKTMRFLGGDPQFAIDKTSYIHHVSGFLTSTAPYEAVFALYDVELVGEEGKIRRFLEVEIERGNKCSPDDGIRILDKWTKIIKNELHVEGPLNESLYEIYSKVKSK